MKKSEDIRYLMNALGTIRIAMLSAFSPNSCIAATRISVEAARMLGLRARPMVCGTTVLNSAAATWARDRGLPQTQEELGAWHAAGCHGVSIANVEHDVAHGVRHLVALIEERWLVDLSLDQACRPQQDILLGPCVFAVTRDEIRDQRVVRDVDGAHVEYDFSWPERGYLLAPDWVDRGRWKPFAKDASALARRRLCLLPRGPWSTDVQLWRGLPGMAS